MNDEYCFISYSRRDACDFARMLAGELKGGLPTIPVWLDKDDLTPFIDWDVQIDHALKKCKMVLFVMTADSTLINSQCRNEYTRALEYNKPIVLLKVQDDIGVPFRLHNLHFIDFTKNFNLGLTQLQKHLFRFYQPEGVAG